MVNCLLYITGNLLRPNIAFDLHLPNSDEELNRALKNIVNTDEMMNRQIVYLLAFGSFYNPNNADTQNTTINVVASTLSQQLNNMASQLLDKWVFGVNFNIDDGTTTDIKNNEYTMNFAYTPNNRVTIIGNVGYKDDKSSNEPSGANSLNNYILDFEVEYKLNQSGKLSAKAYNRTNNYKEFKDAPYTQGVGIVYRESFNSLAELVENWKKNRIDRKENRKQKKEKTKN